MSRIRPLVLSRCNSSPSRIGVPLFFCSFSRIYCKIVWQNILATWKLSVVRIKRNMNFHATFSLVWIELHRHVFNAHLIWKWWKKVQHAHTHTIIPLLHTINEVICNYFELFTWFGFRNEKVCRDWMSNCVTSRCIYHLMLVSILVCTAG